jgi:uroporphyrinogen-III decarboxylase
MGEAALCEACYLNPELLQDILETIGDTVCRILDRVMSEIVVDQIFVHEDMAGHDGPLFGPRQVEEFIVPYYRRVWSLAGGRGCRLFSQDSDGNLNAIISPMLDAGINLMYPNEPAAGMDIVKIRERYGTRLAFMGGIDKHVLRQEKSDILRELEYKIPPMIRSGACVLGLDHRITNGTPIDNYRFYIQKAWEIIEAESPRA